MGKKSRLKQSKVLVETSDNPVTESVAQDAENELQPQGLKALLILTVLVLACLVPFVGKAFNIDDTLFVWAAQHIAGHPLNPFGFDVNWENSTRPMWLVTQNPPLASYYIALIAGILGWSEASLHAGFLLVALAAILGTYVLALRFTRLPLLAAAATLLAPGFLVSGATVMCDTMMVAIFIFAVLFWLEGFDRGKPALLAVSALLIAVCAVTKYFGVALIPLLLAYSIFRQKRYDNRVLYLLLPVALLAGYQYWTKSLYGLGLLGGAVRYAQSRDGFSLYKTLVGLSFAGGCALPALTFAPVIWSRRAILFVGAAATMGATLVGVRILKVPVYSSAHHPFVLSLEMALFIAGGVGAIGLAVSDWRQRRDAASFLLLMWVSGTWVFASFVNWSVNARSVLPMIPAVGILLARRLESAEYATRRVRIARLVIPLVASGMVALWVTWADFSAANTSRMAAQYVRDNITAPGGKVSFEGHWGFQYYMQAYKFEPLDVANFLVGNGDVLVVPSHNTGMQTIPRSYVSSMDTFEFPIRTGMTTMSLEWGSGFYSDNWGPLPYCAAPARPEVYNVLHMKIPSEPNPK